MNTAEIPVLIKMLRATAAPEGADLQTLMQVSGKSRATVYRYLKEARKHLKITVANEQSQRSTKHHWHLIDWGLLDPTVIPQDK